MTLFELIAVMLTHVNIDRLNHYILQPTDNKHLYVY